ncbi:MAG: hypothetical protein JRH16_13020 [Deltaproteobacteria bacterium]|nr:hypothetical protein [Deltaproteobacteria bacterium]MBW2360102.1 hypothetical protein [Deltaproteobacteria bacterium]
MSEVSDARERAASYLGALAQGVECAAFAAREGRAAAAGFFDDLTRDVATASASELRCALGFLDDLRELESPAASRVTARLAELQDPTGHWGPAIREEEAVFETGMIAGHLAKSPCASLDLLDAAGDWLAERFSPDLVQGFRWGNVAAYAHTFANLSHEASDEILQWCGRELERGFRARRFSAVRTVRVLVWCDAPALPGARFEADELTAALLLEQADDGGFGDASDERAARTWDAWIALERLCTRG